MGDTLLGVTRTAPNPGDIAAPNPGEISATSRIPLEGDDNADEVFPIPCAPIGPDRRFRVGFEEEEEEVKANGVGGVGGSPVVMVVTYLRDGRRNWQGEIAIGVVLLGIFTRSLFRHTHVGTGR